jgi:hypothetical protein
MRVNADLKRLSRVRDSVAEAMIALGLRGARGD